MLRNLVGPRALSLCWLSAVVLSPVLGSPVEWKVIPKRFSGPGWSQEWYLVPAIQVVEIRTTPGERVEGGYTEKPSVGRRDNGPERFRHRSLHWTNERRLFSGAATREAPARQVSFALGSVEKDWDFLIQHRDRVLRENGLTLQSPDVDRVRVLARDIWSNHRDREHTVDPKNQSPSSYPADCLLQSSFCVGAGNALVMLCHTMGIPARSIHTYDHTMTEVWIDGRWWFVENTPRNCREGNFMVDASFMEVWSNPFDPRFKFSDHQARYYWEMADYGYMFGQVDGLQMHTGGYRRTSLTPQTAGLLYPETKDIWYKSSFADRYTLLWGRPMAQRYSELKLGQNQMMRRSFWLGSLAETKGLEAQFNLPRGAVVDATVAQIPADGGEWFVAVNGRRHLLRELGGWRLQTSEYENRPRQYYRFAIPLSELKANAWNEIAIGNAAKGDQFVWLGAAIEAIEPAEACFADNLGGN
jgi:hypothetical protein